MICAGAGGDDTASINTVSSECGLLYGAPQPDHKNNSILLTPGSNWSIPMYSCISTTKALIRTVDFRYNGSNDDLSSVTVTGLRDKEYHSESSKPLWGVEKTNETLNNVLPLWGLISSPDQGNISLSTLRKEYLYLPGYVGVSTASGKGYQNLPGVNFHSQALSAAFQIGSTGGDEYSGSNNIALFRHWQQYSGDPSSAGRILDLVWTDRVANAVVGTRGLHDPAPEAANKTQVPVTYYQRRIRYHLPYAIPAILTLALAALAILGALMSCIRSPGTGKMKRLLTKTSQGRILYARASRDAGTAPGFTQVKEGSVAAREFSIPVIGSTSDREWRRTIGRKMVPVAKDGDQLVILDSDVRAAEPLLQGHAVAE